MFDSGAVAQQIGSFVRNHLHSPNKENGPCKKFVLWHLNIDKKPQGAVATINVVNDPGLKQSGGDADYIVNQISNAAQNDANDLKGGIQLYAVYAHFTLNNSYCPRKIFRIAAEEEIEADVSPSEPPTEKGITQMLMRHLEIVSKNSLVSMGYMFNNLAKENNRIRSQNEEFSKQHMALLMLMQESIDNQAKRRIDERQAEMQMSMLEGVFDHLKVAMPVIVNRLAGKDLIPSKIDRGFYLMAAILEGMTPDQQRAFQDMMTPQQLSLFAEALKTYEEKKDEHLKKSNGKGTRELASMFEKRTDLVKTGSAVVVEDEQSKKIEERAKEIMRAAHKTAASTTTEAPDDDNKGTEDKA